jgi:hypothetical protein
MKEVGRMKEDSHPMKSKKIIGLARAWGIYIRSIALAIVARQARILKRMEAG